MDIFSVYIDRVYNVIAKTRQKKRILQANSKRSLVKRWTDSEYRQEGSQPQISPESSRLCNGVFYSVTVDFYRIYKILLGSYDPQCQWEAPPLKDSLEIAVKQTEAVFNWRNFFGLGLYHFR